MTSETVEAFIAVSPRGHRIPSTVRPTADEAWAVLRASVSETDDLHDAGWRIHRLECTVIIRCRTGFLSPQRFRQRDK
jgi:hypothetical protein